MKLNPPKKYNLINLNRWIRTNGQIAFQPSDEHVSNFEASDDRRQSVIAITHAPPSLVLDTRALGEARRGEAGRRGGSKQACRAFLATKRIRLSLSLFDFTYRPLLPFPFLALHLALAHRLVVFFLFAHTLQ